MDHRLPLILLFVSFLTTFIVTRTITRLIRAGVGPFRNNIQGGVHIHHSVPGLILTIVGACWSVAAAGSSPSASISAVLIGIGSSLVLDEFALILHLQDVYWSNEGQLSVQVVSLGAAVLGLMAVGLSPLSDEQSVATGGGIALIVAIVVHLSAVLMCVVKGKYSTAVVGAFISPIAWVGALRMARPNSRWAKKRYSPKKTQHAIERAKRFDERYGKWGLNIEDLVAGRPTRSQPLHPDAPAP